MSVHRMDHAGLVVEDLAAAIAFFVDSWRWEGVPFYVRTGKHLPVTVTEVLRTSF